MSLLDADVHLPDSVRAGIDNFLAAPDGSIAPPISGDSDQHNNAQIPDVYWRAITDLLDHNNPDLLDEADDLPVLFDALDTPSAPLDICLVDDIIWAKFAVLFMQYEDQSLPDLDEVDDMPVSLWVFDLPVTSSDNDIPYLVDIEDDVTVIFYDPSVDHEIVHGGSGA